MTSTIYFTLLLLISSLSISLSRSNIGPYFAPHSGIKFDEYHRLKFAEEKKRLDNFAAQLKVMESAKGFVLLREGPTGNTSKLKARACRAMRYLVEELKTDPKRISTTIAIVTDSKTKLTVELWIGPNETPDDVFAVTLDLGKQEPITIAGPEVRGKCSRFDY